MSHKYNFPAIFLIGPTASGKTSISLELAKQFPIEVVSIDSAMAVSYTHLRAHET